MSKNNLQIFLITYNRIKKLKLTIDSLLKSPVADFDITVLDNASTDGTSELLEKYAKKYKNITHIRHKTNIGGNANICRAFEMGAASGKEYVWVLCDDDKYDFSNWREVEKAIKQHADIVCLADYIYPNKKAKSDPAYQIFQLTFVPAGIYKTSLITDTVLINMYDSIYTMFSQSCITISAINDNANIVVLDKPIVFNGWLFDDRCADVSYCRGCSKDITKRRYDTVWLVGFSNVLSLVKDKSLRERCMEVSVPYKDIFDGWEKCYEYIGQRYITPQEWNYFFEIYNVLPKQRKEEILDYNKRRIANCLDYYSNNKKIKSYLDARKLKLFFKKAIKKLFQISGDLNYRYITLLGLTLKFNKHPITIDDIQLFIITHNRADLLSESIESVLNQTASPKEITVLDNESTDNTRAVVKKYANRGVKYIKTTGFLGNYYKAREMANKKYCMLFHDDDILHPDYLKNVLNVLNHEKDVSLITTRYKEFFSKEPEISQDVNGSYYVFKNQNQFARHVYFVENIAYATAVYNTKFFKCEDLQYDKYNKFNDWPLMVRMAKYGRSILFKDQNMFYVRRHSGQDTWTKTNQPNIEQIINWDLCFYDVFKKFRDSYALKIQKIKAVYFLRGKYEGFVSDKDKKKYSFDDVLTMANKHGLGLVPNIPDFWSDKDCTEYTNALINENYNIYLKRFIKNLFSIDVSPDGQYRILKLFGLSIKLYHK